MADDPASVADALDEWATWHYGKNTAEMRLIRTAARLLRDHADTTNRLTETRDSLTRMDAQHDSMVALYVTEQRRAHAAEARLSALTAANERLRLELAQFTVDEPCNCGWGGVHDPDNPRCDRNIAVAAAVQPPDQQGPTDER